MAENTSEGIRPSSDSGNCEVYLIGPVNLQNSLLNFMIREQEGIPCFCIDELVPSRLEPDRRAIVLLDGNGKYLEELIAGPLQCEQLPVNCFVVYFNIRTSERRKLRREEVAARENRQIFFEDVSLESLLKGIREICRSSSWLSADRRPRWTAVGFEPRPG